MLLSNNWLKRFIYLSLVAKKKEKKTETETEKKDGVKK